MHEQELRREAPVSYDTAGSWWQRQSSAARIGIVAGLLALLGAGGWFGYQATQSTPADDGATVETPADRPADGTTAGGDEGAAPAGSADPAAAPTTATFMLATEPAGATVSIDGQEQGTSPLPLELRLGERYDITMSLDGYHPRTIEDFEATADAARTLDYALERIPPPGALAVQGGFEFSLEVNGNRVSGQQSLRPGTYRVRISAPSVFYSDTRQIEITSGETTTIRLPQTVSVRIAAVPGNAQVIVDDQSSRSFEVPFDLTVVSGSRHRVRFEWPSGDIRERQVQFDSQVSRIIGTASDIEVR